MMNLNLLYTLHCPLLLHPSSFILSLFCLLPAAAAEVDQEVLDAEAGRIAVIEKAKESVLAIFAASGEGGGSGVVISPDGYALTNFHVVKPCGHRMQCGMSDGRLYEAVIVGLDPTGDVALIKLFGRDDFPPAEMADSDQVQAGDWVFAMGNPFLLATDFQPTVTYGIVSGVHRYQYPSGTLLEYTDCLQTDASINPGNSGGPLFDAEGRLIGINGRASFEKRGRVNVGVAYAVSINQIKNFLGCLKSGRIVDHATLGARVALDADGRVVVSDILESSDAYRRGLRYDDEIVSFGARPVLTPNGFKNVLGIYPKGWRVPLSFRRDGRRHDVLVRLAGVHTEGELLEKAEGRRRLRPGPIPHPGDDQESEEPKPEEGKPVVEEHFEAKRGYANYYFNKLNRDRVFGAWIARGDLASLDGAWTIGGPLQGGGRFRFQLTATDAVLTLPAFEHRWTAADGLGTSPPPPGSGGLLSALYLWRRLAVEGLGNFGEVHYLGTVPLAGRDEQVEVLVGIYGGAECRFLFDGGEGYLLAVEMFPEEDVDPCEVYFFDYRPLEGRWLPGRMEVRFGDDLYGVFQLDEFSFEKAK